MAAKPMFLIKPNTMSKRDIRRAEKECGLVIVECEQPESVRLLEPPLAADSDAQARAALTLMRKVIFHDGPGHASWSKDTLTGWFTRILIEAPQPPAVQKVKR